MSFRSFSRFFTSKQRTLRKAVRSRGQRPSGSTARLLMETLEERWAPAVLPAPTVDNLAQLDFSGPPTNVSRPQGSSVYGPQLAMDPLNPNILIEAHAAYFDATNTAQIGDGGEIWGNFSLDGGRTWASTSGLFLNSAILDPSTNGLSYSEISNVGITFDRVPADPVTGEKNFYVVSLQRNSAGNSGAIVFNKFTLDTDDGFIQQDFSVGEHVIYRWFNTDPAFKPVIAINNNEPVYTDPLTGLTQIDSMATLLNDSVYGLVPKAIYVAWNTLHTYPQANPQPPDTSNVMIAASANGGHDWSTHQFVTNDFPNQARHYIYANGPQISFSQGTPFDASDPTAVPRIPGGALNIVYTDSLNPANANVRSEIYIDQSQPDGGDPAAYAVAAQSFIDDFGGFVFDSANAGGVITEFTLPVNLNADGFFSLDDLDVELHLQTPNANHLLIELVAPTGEVFILVRNRLDAGGNTIGGNNPVGLPAGPDIGIVTGPAPGNSKNLAGTFFDLDAPRRITDGTAAVPWIGHYRPEPSFFPGFGGWDSLYSRPIADLNGDWTLRITDFRDNGANAPAQILRRWGLHFTSQIDTNGFDQSENFVTFAGVLTAVDTNYPTANTVVPTTGVSPGAVAAYDNTLGSFSPYQGRLYVAYVSRGFFVNNEPANQAGNPDISVIFSDDNGLTWSQPFLVNDDQNDSFSEGNRAQFLPALAVDPITGAVVVSYFDARYDAARLRVANSLQVSIDGGRSYSPSVLLNDIKGAGNFLTGERIDLEPIPGNQALNGLYGFGDRQGLVVWGGRAIPVFGTNLDPVNANNNTKNSLIRAATVSFASGPRIIQGDMGPIDGVFHNPNNGNVYSYNNTFASDGTRQLDGFVVTFDRPIDPSTFDTGDVTIIYRDPVTGVERALTPAELLSVTPINLAQQHGVVDAVTQPSVAMGSALVVEGNSGAKQAIFTVYLSQPLFADVTVGYATQNGSAQAGLDYVAKTGTVTIPAGQTSATFAISVLGDTLVEGFGAENFFVNITSVSPGLRRLLASGVGRIIDDDAARSITVGNAVLQEGDSGTRIMSFPVILSSPDSVNPVSFSYSTASGTATQGIDFDGASGTVTFAPGQTTAQIDVVVRGDLAVDGDEFFNLFFFAASGAFLTSTSATGTILEDDDFGARPTVSISDALVQEGDSGPTNANFTVVLSQALPYDVIVNVATVDGSARASQGDYVFKAAQVVIPREQTSATFSVVVNGDVAKEGNETFRAIITGASAGVVPGRLAGVATIVDDDGAPAVTLGDAIIQEGNNGDRILSFPIALSVANLTDPVTVSYAGQSGTATLGQDFSVTPGTFTFDPGQVFGFIEVTIHGDQIIETGNEQFTLTISEAVNAAITGGVATGTIVDDDVLGLTVGDVFVQEGVDGPGPLPPVTANVVVYLNAPTSQNVTFNYQTVAVSATAGADYTTTTGTATIVAGQTSIVIPVPILYDTQAEPLETFLFQITSSTNASLVRGTATITIVDNDELPDVTIGDLVVRENVAGGIALVPVFLSFPIAQPVTVNYTVTPGPSAPNIGAASPGTDYTDLGGGTLVIPANTQTAFLQIQINNDNVAEITERLTINITGLATSNAELSNKTSGVVTIVDNDVSVSIGDVTERETNGATNFFFTVYLSSPSEQAIAVNVATANGTATTGDSDYNAVGTTVNFAPGQTQQNVVVTVVGDTVNENNETFFVNITSVTGNADIAKAQAIGTIVDDDNTSVLWSIGDVTVLEGDAGVTPVTFTIFVSQPSPVPLSIQYFTTAGTATAGADFAPVFLQTAFLPAGAFFTTITINVLGDLLQEGNETFTVTIQNPSNGGTPRKGTATATIVDDDQQVIVFGDVNVVEGDSGASFVTVPVLISNANPTSVPFDFQTTDGSAVAPSDYFSASGSVQFFAGQSVRNLFVLVVGDTLEEGNENFSVDLLTPVAGTLVPKPSSRVNIVDNDDLKVSISDMAIQEGTGGNLTALFTVYLNGLSSAPVNIQFTTEDGTAGSLDYTPNTNGSLTIPANARSATISIPINPDDLNEGNETFFVRILSVQGAGIEKDLGAALIVDDDLTPALTIGPSFFREADGQMVFTVYSSFPIAAPIQVTVTTSDGLATAGADYTAVNTVLTIPANQTSVTFTVDVFDDDDSEGNEDFTVTLSNPTQRAVLATASAQGLIVDDEPAVHLNIGDALVKEGSGGVFNVAIPVILSSAFDQDITVHYQTADGSATAGSDYVAIADQTLVIPAGETEVFITVQVRGDAVLEGIEEFFVNLFAAAGAVIAKSQAVVTIVDDDNLYGATQFLIRLAPQSAVGTYSYAIGPDIGSRIQWVDHVNGGASVTHNLMDQNNNSIAGETGTSFAFQNDTYSVPHAELNVPFQGPYDPDSMPLIIPGPHLSATGFKTSTFATAVPANIPASGAGGTGNYFTDTGVSKLAVAGLAGQLADLNVRVSLNYPDSGHLVLRLRAPNGQVILLSQERGTGNFFLNTTFDDQASASVVNATGPYTSVRPESPLSALNYLDAEALNGEWSLEVEDTNGAATGRILDWRLTFAMTNAADYPAARFSKHGNEPVPDLSDLIGNPQGTLISTLNVSNLTGWITDVNVRVDLDFPNSGFLTLTLIAPNGSAVSLASFNGDGNHFQGTLFDDQADVPINFQTTSGSFAVTSTDTVGPFLHVHPAGFLSLFNGIDAGALKGDWQLVVTSFAGTSMTGTLKGWSLDITTSQFTDNLVLNGSTNHLDIVFDRDINPGAFTAADVLRMMGPAGVINGPFTVQANPPGTPAAFANRTFRIGFPTQSLSGTYQIQFSSNIDAVLGGKIDTNLNAGLDALLGGTAATGTLGANTYSPLPNSQGTPAPGANTTPMTVPIPGNSVPVVVNLEINEEFRIAQTQASHIQVFLDMTLTSSNASFDAVLIAPDGTEIRLFTNVGFQNTPGVPTRITLDDFIGPAVEPGRVFGVATLKPQIPLSRLLGKFTSGVWQLRIVNSGGTLATLNDWSLRFPHYQSGSGVGEAVADQFSAGFRIFTTDPSLPLSSSSWTAVGPAPTNQFGSAGRVTAIAVDPSDPSGNTVFIGGASGGVWKTTNFLTTDPQGPTYVPLTDLGPSNSLNIGSVAVIGRNNDPRQSIIFAGTGDTDSLTNGIGLLRSMDGGATWQVIDSTNDNFDASGNPLPLNSTQRNHDFARNGGSRVNKVVIDPTPDANGNYVIYAAVGGGPAQGLYRSNDTGDTWTLLKAGNATDIVLVPSTRSISTGRLLRLYAAFQDDGIYTTDSAPVTTALPAAPNMAGGVGKPNHRVLNPPFNPGPAMGVNAPSSTPDGGGRGRVLLATPALTNDPLADEWYKDWLYALVVDGTGSSFDLYVTKDQGDNWTRVVLPVAGNAGRGVPTNDENIGGTSSELDPYGNVVTVPSYGGNFQAALTIDPDNPNIVYIGCDFILRVDITTMKDVWSMIIGDHSDNVAGAGNGPTAGGVSPGTSMLDNTAFGTPGVPNPRDDHFNMFGDPYNPRLTSDTYLYTGTPSPFPLPTMQNTGTNVRWSYFSILNDPYNTSFDINPSFIQGGTSEPLRAHELIALTDPLTGKTRLLLGNDQGVFTGVDRGDGTIHTGIGAADSVRGSRNGNLQIAQFVAGAVQPTTLAADIASALFYGMAVNNGAPSSSADIISTGNLNWQTFDQTRFADLISMTVDGNGSWIVTDPTGGFDHIEPDGTIIFDPNRIGTTYQYLWPCCNNQGLTALDFFMIDFPNQPPLSSTIGLLQPGAQVNVNTVLFNGAVPRPFGRFAVNPLNPAGIVISATNGRLYRTSGPIDNLQWDIIAANGVLGGTAAQALAFGSPLATVDDPNSFIYAGTDGGRLFVTFDGGGAWRDISAGLDGSNVLSISPNPRRGTREVVAITTSGVYYLADSGVANPVWERLNDTPGRGELFTITRPVFNNANDPQVIMAAGEITSLAVDWRYAIPDNLNQPNGPTHPIVYVAGNAGVFKTVDKGLSWRLYPDLATDGAPQEGGFLPNVRVTDLDLMLGYIDPNTGKYNHSDSQNVLMASTYGRGAFAIRLDDAGLDDFLVDRVSGPRVIAVAPVSPSPGFRLEGFDVTFNGPVDLTTFKPNDVVLRNPNGQIIPIAAITEIAAPSNPLNPRNQFRIHIAPRSQSGTYRLEIGPDVRDFGGNKMNQDGDKRNGEVPDDIFRRNIVFTPNTAPTISPIADQFTLPNVQSAAISFTINDGQTPANLLILRGTSSDQALVDDANIVFGGSGGNRTVLITPEQGALGPVIITIEVEDPQGLLASTSFTLTINTPPVLVSPNPIPDAPPQHHTQYPIIGYVTLFGTDDDAGAQLAYFAEAFADAALTQPLSGLVVVNPNTGQLDLTPTNFSGTYFVRAGVSDGFQSDSDVFTVTVENTPPTLDDPADVTLHHSQFPHTVTLNGQGNDPESENLTYDAKAYEINNYTAYQLDQQLNLRRHGKNFSFNERGKREKYFKGPGRSVYYILPNGRFFRFRGNEAKVAQLRGVFVHQFTKPYWKNPNLLAFAQPPTELTGFVAVSGDQLTITPPAGFLGKFLVEAVVSDGADTAKQTFIVTVTNTPPTFSTELGTVTGTQAEFQGGVTRPLSGADADSQDQPNLQYSATAYEAITYQAWSLDQQYKLQKSGPGFDFNERGRREKYFKGAGNKLFYILPNGHFFQFRGSTAPGSPLRGKRLAVLDSSYWSNPNKLANAVAPTELPGFVSVDNNADTITFSPDSSFIGLYFVEAFVSDGNRSAKQVIRVVVSPNSP